MEYLYDSLGRRTELHTFRGGTGWAAGTWPTSPGDDDVTTWIYEPGSGLLLEKQYDGHSAQGPIRNIEYTYTDEGKLETRTWSRSGTNGRIITTYDYDDATGELTDITYNDGVTPPVEFNYDRLGRQEEIIDVVGTRVFAYNDDPNTGDLQLLTEDIGTETGDLYSKLVTRVYQPGTGSFVAGRPAGFKIGSAQDTDADYSVTYSYDGISRLNGILGTGLPANGVLYSFVTDSDLVESISFRPLGTVAVSANFTYEDHRDLIESVENTRAASPTPPISKYAYVNDAIGRRTSVVHTGSAFSSDRLFKWGYNTRSELTSADRHAGTDPDNPGSLMTPGDYDYSYDPIGNRTSSNVDNANPATTYTANELNQYTATANPSESFTYDADGNLIDDGTYEYTWDGENRLIGVAPASSPVNSDKKLEFKYDYMNRRVEKKVYTYNSGWGSPTQLLRFVYDQWNVVLVLDDAEDVLTKYTWGLDLSGQRGNPAVEGIHDTGGIGGLLAVEETATGGTPQYWFLYDANGNVTQLVQNTTNYPLAAHYEYDAYGNVLGTPTGYAAANPFRFSTKWFDEESGLGYWGERYRRERWLSRDPIGELGGLNLYAYVAGNPISLVDFNGLFVSVRPSPFLRTAVGGTHGARAGWFTRLSGDRLPAVGQELIELAERRGGDSGEDIAEVFERIHFVALAGGDKAEEDGGRVTAVV